MHLKKYSYRTFALLLCCGCTDQCTDEYIRQEKQSYYTQNPYNLGGLKLLEDTIIPQTSDAITNLRKKLADRMPKWLITGTEQAPDTLWYRFFIDEINGKIVDKLKKAHDTTLLTTYYTSLGNLFKEPTEDNEKKLIIAASNLQANTKLIKAFNALIAERSTKPETIYLTKSTLEYQEFLCFILEKPNPLPIIKLNKVHSNLKQWQEDGHPTGQNLWKRIEQKYKELLRGSRLYGYSQNQEAIEQSLRLIDRMADNPYTLSYRDLLETLPHGIRQLKDILYEVGLEEKDDIKLLKTYLDLVSCLC